MFDKNLLYIYYILMLTLFRWKHYNEGILEFGRKEERQLIVKRSTWQPHHSGLVFSYFCLFAYLFVYFFFSPAQIVDHLMNTIFTALLVWARNTFLKVLKTSNPLFVLLYLECTGMSLLCRCNQYWIYISNLVIYILLILLHISPYSVQIRENTD